MIEFLAAIGNRDFFDPLCQSSMGIMHAEKVALKAGVSSRICLKPIGQYTCCCNCFNVTIPSTTLAYDASAQGGGNPKLTVVRGYTFNLKFYGQLCREFNSSYPTCSWGNAPSASAHLAKSIPTVLLQYTYPLSNNNGWAATLSVSYNTPVLLDSFVEASYSCSNFTCSGGTFTKTTDTGTGLPTTLAVTAGNCDSLCVSGFTQSSLYTFQSFNGTSWTSPSVNSCSPFSVPAAPEELPFWNGQTYTVLCPCS